MNKQEQEGMTEEQAYDHNKNAVFAALAAAGIGAVYVSFDGYGDSGQIESHSTDTGKPLPDVPVDFRNVTRGKPDAEQKDLYDAIEALCYDALNELHPGWEINDGTFGDFTFNVKDKTIRLECNTRYTDVNTTVHER